MFHLYLLHIIKTRRRASQLQLAHWKPDGREFNISLTRSWQTSTLIFSEDCQRSAPILCSVTHQGCRELRGEHPGADFQQTSCRPNLNLLHSCAHQQPPTPPGSSSMSRRRCLQPGQAEHDCSDPHTHHQAGCGGWLLPLPSEQLQSFARHQQLCPQEEKRTRARAPLRCSPLPMDTPAGQTACWRLQQLCGARLPPLVQAGELEVKQNRPT